MAEPKYVYLVRIGDATIRAYTSKRELKEFLESLEGHLLYRYLIQRLAIGHHENKLEIKPANEVLAIWRKAESG